MRIAIDAPAKRSLSPTEKKVYNLLQGGNTPKEVAQITRLPYGAESTFCFDPTIPTIKNIITAIREKGWEIPEPNKNKEEIEMPKYTAAQKAEVIELYKSGMKTGQIANKMKNINPKTIASWITEYRKSTEFAIEISKPLADSLEKENEPAQAATCTDSGVENIGNVSTPIINEKVEVVKRVFSESILDAAYKLICDKQNEILAYNKKLEGMYKALETINARIAATDDMILYAEQELDRLWEDYAALCGEVAE